MAANQILRIHDLSKRSRAAVQVTEQGFPGVEAEGNHSLLIPFTVDDGVTFWQVEQRKVEGRNFIHAEAAVQHESTDAIITELQRIAEIERGHETSRLFIG